METYWRVPDCIRAHITLFLSTPTADIIKADVIRQYNLMSSPDKPISEYYRLYNTVCFTELKWDCIINRLLRFGSFTISPAQRVRFVMDYLRIRRNVRLYTTDDDSDIENDDDI